MKKVLILTVTAGNGHHSCAYAMRDKLLQQPDIEVRVVDLLREFSTKRKVWLVDRGYSLSVARMRKTYNFFYEKYRKSKPQNRYKCSAQDVSVSVVEGLYKYIWEYRPDVIFSTHFYGAIALTDLRLVANIPASVVVPCLDFVNSPFWEAGIGVDYLALPTEELREVFEKLGYSPKQLVATGMPVNEKSYYCEQKSVAREKLGLDADKFTLLLMFGGGNWAGGYKMFDKLIDVLDMPVQVIKINGKDNKSYKMVEKRLARGKIPPCVQVTNVGFTRDVPLYLAAADCSIGKMGGLSAVEAINTRTPVFVTTKLPGQEIHNLDYMQNKGCAFPFRNKKELSALVHEFFNNRDKIEQVHKICDSLRCNGAENLANLLLSQPEANYDDKDKLPADGLQKRVRRALRKAHSNRAQ